MILSCNSCQKKFVVPDSAIGVSGRLVQCSACGNKWKQFPEKKEIKSVEKISKINTSAKKIKEITKKSKKKSKKKKTGPDLYSPEYLAKKHGIKLNEALHKVEKKSKNENNVGIGFYNFLVILTAFLVLIFGLLINTQDLIITRFPGTEIYINHIFESIKNISDIFKNFFSGY